jgi:dTDP-4-dehydrorhamnose 3,5-epimerase
MQIKKLCNLDVTLIEPNVYRDERGFFLETHSEKYDEIGTFVQDNVSLSTKMVFRGMHYQEGEYAQGKLVTVLHGAVWDFYIDIRPDSPTFKESGYFLLDGKKPRQLYIPPGYAHGFLSLEDNTVFSYKCTTGYNQSSEKSLDPYSCLNFINFLSTF